MFSICIIHKCFVKNGNLFWINWGLFNHKTSFIAISDVNAYEMGVWDNCKQASIESAFRVLLFLVLSCNLTDLFLKPLYYVDSGLCTLVSLFLSLFLLLSLKFWHKLTKRKVLLMVMPLKRFHNALFPVALELCHGLTVSYLILGFSSSFSYSSR